jgi:hypothetical protein
VTSGRSCDIGSRPPRTLLSGRPPFAAPALADLPRERRAHLLTEHAIGEKQAGLRTADSTTLLQAEEEAPEEVRCRPRTKQLVKDLRLLGVGSAEGRLRALADRCGLPR